MAIGHFVYEGFNFRTIDIAASLLGLRGTGNVAVVILEDVVQAMTDTGAFTPILAGDDPGVKMNTLTSYWTTRQQGLREVHRDVLNARAPLLDPNPSDVDDTRGSPVQYNVHKEANAWILPQGFNQIIEMPNMRNKPVGGQRLSLVDIMIFNHTNVRKYPSEAEAWDAWTNYTLLSGLDATTRAARAGYYVNP